MTSRPRDIAFALIDLLTDGQKPEAVAKSFADFTKRYDRRDLIAPVIKALATFQNTGQGDNTLTITTAQTLSPSAIKKIQTAIKLTDLKPEVVVDPKLWAGWQVLYQDVLYDASIANKINKLTK